MCASKEKITVYRALPQCTVVELIREEVTKSQKSVECQNEFKKTRTNKMFYYDIKGMFRALILLKERVFAQSTRQK